MSVVQCVQDYTLTCAVSGRIDSKTRMTTNSSTYEAGSSGADVKHVSWWGLVQYSYCVEISRRTSQRKLRSE